ncbi:hypothetical protein GCM10010430_50720 [Kitasatospora cystarginea]|uniref:Uncharacterized protein n=1 Tax=Kitasatospora cystarginea TaxID=58350 RepID=A0ABN3EJG2_9ACTN
MGDSAALDREAGHTHRATVTLRPGRHNPLPCSSPGPFRVMPCILLPAGVEAAVPASGRGRAMTVVRGTALLSQVVESGGAVSCSDANSPGACGRPLGRGGCAARCRLLVVNLAQDVVGAPPRRVLPRSRLARGGRRTLGPHFERL